MKRALTIIGLLAFSTALFTGCITSTTGRKVPDVAAMQTVAKTAAYVGSKVWLEKNPADRPTFEKVRLGLRTMIAAGTFDAAQLTALLRQLPIKELRSDEGAIAVDAAVVLWDQYGRQLAELDKAQVFPTYLLPVAQSILDGFDLALGK